MSLSSAILVSSFGGYCLKFPAYINSYLNRIGRLEAWYQYYQLAQASGDRVDGSYEERSR